MQLSLGTWWSDMRFLGQTCKSSGSTGALCHLCLCNLIADWDGMCKLKILMIMGRMVKFHCFRPFDFLFCLITICFAGEAVRMRCVLETTDVEKTNKELGPGWLGLLLSSCTLGIFRVNTWKTIQNLTGSSKGCWMNLLLPSWSSSGYDDHTPDWCSQHMSWQQCPWLSSAAPSGPKINRSPMPGRIRSTSYRCLVWMWIFWVSNIFCHQHSNVQHCSTILGMIIPFFF